MADDQTPDMPPAEKPTDIAGMLESMNVTFGELERYVAGYNTLTRTYQTISGTLPPGQRPKGMLLTFKGSVDDVHAIDVTIDVQKHIDPQHAAYVFVPLANGQAVGMLHAINALLEEGERLRDLIQVALAPPQPAKTT